MRWQVEWDRASWMDIAIITKSDLRRNESLVVRQNPIRPYMMHRGRGETIPRVVSLVLSFVRHPANQTDPRYDTDAQNTA